MRNTYERGKSIEMSNRTIGKVLSAIACLALIMPLASCGSGSSSNDAGDTQNGVRTVQAVTYGLPAPFTFKDASGQVSGQNIELTEAIFKHLPQYKLKWNVADFSGLLTGLDAGRYQIGVNNMSKTKEREAKYLYSDPIYSNRYVAVFSKRAGITKLNSLADLAGLKVLVCSEGCNVSLALAKYNKEHPDKASNLVYSPLSTADAIRQVENGTGDAYLLDEPTFGYLKKKVGFNAQQVELSEDAQKELSPDSYSYLIFSKDQTQLRDDVNKALKEVIKDGTSKAIDEKWFGSDQTPTNE